MILGLTGASGFVGSLFHRAARKSHTVVGFSRKPGYSIPGVSIRTFTGRGEDDFSGLDAVIHLAGESLLGIWTAAKKRRIRDSRVNLTRSLVASLKRLDRRPDVLVSASAIGIYGDRGDALLTELTHEGGGFVADVVRDWEGAAMAAETFGVRTVCLRFGVILGREGGAFPLLRRIFACGFGGPLGSGNQWMPWIHVDDVVQMILFVLRVPSLRGPVNAVAPAAVTNRRFASELARALHRPAFIRTPAPFLRLIGRDQSRLFLDSVHAHPKKVLQAGYPFIYPTLPTALEECLRPSSM